MSIFSRCVVNKPYLACTYLIQCAIGDAGRDMISGEFRSMTEFFKTMPDFVPRPIAWGKFKTSDTYFLLKTL